MSSDNNSGPAMMIGGLILIGFLFWSVFKMLIKVFETMTLMFSKFGEMAQSFVGMLWSIAKVLGLAGLGIFVIVAAVYFTYKYILLVKRGTEIKEYAEAKGFELQESLLKSQNDFEKRLLGEVASLRSALTLALERPTVAPPPPESATVDTNSDSTAHHQETILAPTETQPIVTNTY